MSLDERRRELIERRLRQRGVNVIAEEAIPRVTRDGTFPLSFAQARLWFLDQLSPGNPFYNVQTSIRHRGVVDHTALQAAVGLLVERHESLRTVFRVVGGEPRQVVLPVVRVPLEAHDLRHLPPSERQGEAVRIALEQLERPYDLTTGPLLRTKLVRLDEREFVLLVGVHHVVADGWSVGVLSRELGEVYGDLVGGGDGRVLAPLVVQYVDFAVWQRERLAGEWLVGELGWWRGALDGLSGLALPTDRARPAVQGHRGAGFGFVVDRSVVESVGVVARGSSATSFMVALAVWAVVLGRWCGQDEVVVGAPIAGRDRAELEGLIGFFVNTLVLRVDVSGDPTFAELVGRVREVALGAYAHAEVPFEKLVEELAPQRDLSRNPLFQVTFQLFDSPAAEGGIGDGLEIPVSSSLFDIRLDMWPAAGGWAGRVEFDSDLFERASIEALIDRFVWLLGEAAADPGRRIGSWALLPDEHRRLLQQWNDTAAAVPAITVVDAFAEQVAVNADCEAVSDDEGTWTYRQLDDESRIVARRLGDARRQVIAVCLPRGRRFAAATLGVMRAGAAYLPLDPAYPTARLSYILAHANADAVITTDDLATQLDLPAATTPITTYTTDVDDLDAVDAVDVTVTDLAYVIYTSGSTGEPKGVEIEHHSLTNLCHWHTTTYHTTPDDRATQIASVGFDAAVWELWPYLTCGASVHTVTDHTRNDPDLLIDWLHTHHITITFIPTPLAETLLDHPWPPNSPLRYLLTGGDTLHHHPNPEHPYTLINHYGPTETTVVATATTTHGIPPTNQPPTIGHPITNTTITIIDPAGQPAGPHQPGELTISGPTLARGYHHDPTLTHQRFTTTPGHPARRYHTGDLARWNHDGTITYLGRTDHQLKIRGHRIEPAELETIITTHPNITHTTITTHTNPTTNTPGHRPDPGTPGHRPDPGTPQLCAYITTTNPTPTPTQLADQVAAWRALYERTYGAEAVDDDSFDIRGWNSSDRGTPLGPAVMGEQVDQTVDRILALRPTTILEVGCGTGLLTHRLVPHCARYVGTDFSATAVAQLRRALEASGWSDVELLEREALDLDGIDGPFDVVVLNSVIQYFPSLAYLDAVLDRCIAAVAPHGALFVGDVRNHTLLDVFHTDVERSRAEPSTTVDVLAGRVRRAVANEQELLVDPGWFTELAAKYPRVMHVAAEPRRGHHYTELTRYRYDVSLSFDDTTPQFTGVWVDWEAAQLTPVTLLDLLGLARQPVGVRGVPSARLAVPVESCRRIAGGDGRVGDLDRDAAGGVDPEQLWNLDGVAVEIGWHEGGSSGRYDVVATPLGVTPQRLPPPTLAGRIAANEPIDSSAALLSSIRHWLHEQLPAPLVPTHLIAIDHVPLTPNGKVDLSALPDPVSPPTQDTATSEPLEEHEAILAEAWRDILGVGHVGRDDNFFEVGGDSILAIKLVNRAAQAGLHVSTSDVFQHQTVAELARVASTTPRVHADQGAVVGPVPLTPVQRWFVELRLDEPHHFNQAASIPLDRSVDPRLLVRALRAVVDHHDAMRLRLDGDALSFDSPGGELKVITADLSSASPGELARVLDRASSRVQASVSLDGGAVRAALFDLGPLLNRRMLVAIHHLAVDAVSWGIILEDLWTAYEQLAAGRPTALPRKTTSFRDWSRRLGEHAGEAETLGELGFWREQLGGAAVTLPVDRPEGANTVGDSTTMRVELTADETDRLLRGPTSDLLIAAAAGALARWTGRSAVTLAVEGHGRESILDDVDLSRTVGWFTTIYPLRLNVSAPADEGALLSEIVAELDDVPRRGIGFGLLRYLSPEATVRAELAVGHWPPVSFNYLGRLDTVGPSPSDPLHDVTGSDRSRRGRRPYLIDLNGAVSRGRLWFDVHYSTAQFERSTIERFAVHLSDLLGAVAALAGADAPRPIETADGVSSDDVAAVLARLAEGERP